MHVINDKLKSWATDLDEQTTQQARRTARLPVVAGHVALMADAHLGLGATVGSVVPTAGAVIPACVGVDIGCGMAAVRTDLMAADLPDELAPLLTTLEKAVPAGVGRGHDSARRDDASAHAVATWLKANRPQTVLSAKQERTARDQLGTLGSGNHFVEVSLDEDDRVWVVLHSGSRGIGNQLAMSHISEAKSVARRFDIGLEDPDLAYLLEGTKEFTRYVADLRFAQAYARVNRDTMLDVVLLLLFRFVGKGRELERVNCHHNYTAKEQHFGRELWVTRKGAISARKGERGIVPGSMGTDTYIVVGLGNPESYNSSAHGAGRRMSRRHAKRTLSVESLEQAMVGRTWLDKKAVRLLDEHPDAYKDVDEVMRSQADLVEVADRLRAVLNYKGT